MAEFLINTVGLPAWLSWSVTAIVAAALILNVIAGGALVFIWAERKIAGRIQDRLGPTRTG
ncbi:MAG: NADH-quinone oxidoreductase subunit H, partial [Pirellulales bacterium]